ncbi:homocysteine methyltransferase [Rhizobium laguerreae]|uniref:homocysteine S-methyltransferase family protein n=1 Tax=Rhizobium laguerreae TaxID=1076926 RepID=UPI001C91C782|nr:homocysteine S-methyltransferase family protein [Rhizobium laguerreae]MBY3153883.1 homocysteine methyltransferase [Rhizobium laguerreae]
MAKYRNGLPQLKGGTFITDGGMETTMIFQEGIELPHFAAFILLASEDGRQRMRNYYRRYLDVARRHGTGFVLDTATWRANPDWGQKLNYTTEALKAVNEEAVDLLVGLRSDYERPEQPVVISGAIGPRGDGYKAGIMDAAEAEDYHAFQIGAFAGTEADMVSAFTLTNIDEAIGVARAAQALGMPSAISFTLETDGRLVTGRSLQEAIETTDAMTGGAPAYYMINCAHPTHFETALDPASAWVKRISGIRANASTMSHEQLDNSETLDAGDPEDLGRHYRKLIDRMPALSVLGGCCGTDHRHVAAICEACLPQAA